MNRKLDPRWSAWSLGLIPVLLALGSAADTSAVEEQWRHSGHADSMSTKDEQVRMNTKGCAHCHTAQGYWHERLGGKPSAAPYEKAVGITCITCHETDGKKISAALRVADVKRACTGCHDILVENKATAFSSCPQGSVLRGKAGARFKGASYRSGAHSRLEKNCVTCHMAAQPKPDRRVGGHTFRVTSKGSAPRVFNPNGCTMCHKGISLAWIEKKQAEVKAQIETLKSLLPAHKGDDPKDAEPRPRYPRDPSLTRIQAKAALNYWEVVKDGTFGVHNPVYIRQLIQTSIQALKKEKSGRAALSKRRDK